MSSGICSIGAPWDPRVGSCHCSISDSRALIDRFSPADVQLAQNLKKLSIEELTRLDITTASRRVEPLAQAAAAASVLRGEDLRRAGVTNLAEALRLADGIDVARADNETWAISTRGFNIPTANEITIALTAYASERDRERSALAGYQRHLAKPIDPLELVNVIAGMLPTEVQPRG